MQNTGLTNIKGFLQHPSPTTPCKNWELRMTESTITKLYCLCDCVQEKPAQWNFSNIRTVRCPVFRVTSTWWLNCVTACALTAYFTINGCCRQQSRLVFIWLSGMLSFGLVVLKDTIVVLVLMCYSGPKTLYWSCILSYRRVHIPANKQGYWPCPCPCLTLRTNCGPWSWPWSSSPWSRPWCATAADTIDWPYVLPESHPYS